MTKSPGPNPALSLLYLKRRLLCQARRLLIQSKNTNSEESLEIGRHCMVITAVLSGSLKGSLTNEQSEITAASFQYLNGSDTHVTAQSRHIKRNPLHNSLLS